MFLTHIRLTIVNKLLTIKTENIGGRHRKDIADVYDMDIKYKI